MNATDMIGYSLWMLAGYAAASNGIPIHILVIAMVLMGIVNWGFSEWNA